ncbi:MAG: alpha/beta fold hydrolase [Betaproteobacteria bacterium]|nr:alpha/beta fold hydrolase [Betaproteobacteria bacterium]
MARLPAREVGVPSQRIVYRTAGDGLPLVMLHGIGGGSGSWLPQLESLGDRFRLIAWDAPGYGTSALIDSASPNARHYAAALTRLLDALQIERCLLVGQSLGALMATAFARAFPSRLHGLLLLGPAAGYGTASQPKRDEILAGRMDAITKLGPDGMAATRASALLATDASAEARELVAAGMRRLRPEGYAQAARLLVNGDLAADARLVRVATLVGCGTVDTITPEAGCRVLAAAFTGCQYHPIPGAGHASNIDQPDRVNTLIAQFASHVGAL